MKPVRAMAVATTPDVYDLYVYEPVQNRPYARFRSRDSEHWTHIGSPIDDSHSVNREKKISDLVTDCINAIILLGGPVTRIESLELNDPEDGQLANGSAQ